MRRRGKQGNKEIGRKIGIRSHHFPDNMAFPSACNSQSRNLEKIIHKYKKPFFGDDINRNAIIVAASIVAALIITLTV